MARIFAALKGDFSSLDNLREMGASIGNDEVSFDVALLGMEGCEDQRKKQEREIQAKAQELKINLRVLKTDHLGVKEIVEKTPFYDMVFFDYASAFHFVDGEDNSEQLFKILIGSRCPVVIIPSNYSEVNNLIFTYDGKDASIFAIKMFALLFGKNCKDMEVTILSVVQEDESMFGFERHLMDFVQSHFKNVGLKHVYGEEVSTNIHDFSQTLSDSLVIMGAYDREADTYKERPSAARGIIFQQDTPLFIAHH
ncbi:MULTISPECIES: hypothetical protein [Persicobacter]|uniref:Universal stress protein n=1 Tax=Persicobacter diffluens TaxID=981 RepID=A0AAN5AK38_9BACT|nr:hypothetical protein [Persicobacter sp. CCB-QB2]GJM60071.1 hypothetical protein PEDI_06230 [Persicobacter diffluens]